MLLTTPFDIFSIDETIFISRGLLNLVPDESTLAGLLALQIAHIRLGHSRLHNSAVPPFFDTHRHSDFPGFGWRRTANEEEFGRERMQSLLAGTTDAGSVVKAELFLQEIARLSPTAPHLTSGLVLGQGQRLSFPASESRVVLQLRGDYGISSWKNLVVGRNQTPHGEASAVMNQHSSSPSTAIPNQP